MTQERLIRFDGKVIEALPDGRYRVRFPNNHEVTADANPNIDREALMKGESITVEISPDDMSTGRLIFRHKETR